MCPRSLSVNYGVVVIVVVVLLLLLLFYDRLFNVSIHPSSSRLTLPIAQPYK